MFPYPDLSRLPVTSTANGQLLSGHSIPLHSIKFQTVPLISRKFHDILLKCTRKSASRSAFGQLPLERRMRIQRGKGKTTILPGYQTGLLHVQTSDKTHQMGHFFCRTVSQGCCNHCRMRLTLADLFVSSCGPRGVGHFFLLLLGAY